MQGEGGQEALPEEERIRQVTGGRWVVDVAKRRNAFLSEGTGGRKAGRQDKHSEFQKSDVVLPG